MCLVAQLLHLYMYVCMYTHTNIKTYLNESFLLHRSERRIQQTLNLLKFVAAIYDFFFKSSTAFLLHLGNINPQFRAIIYIPHLQDLHIK